MPRLYLCLERNIVFHVVELAGRLLSRGGLRLGGPRLGRALARLARLPGTGARAEHLHGVGDDLGGVTIVTFLVLPLARAQPPLDVDLRAFLQIFAGDLGEARAKDDAVPFGLFLLLAARLVVPRV